MRLTAITMAASLVAGAALADPAEGDAGLVGGGGEAGYGMIPARPVKGIAQARRTGIAAKSEARDDHLAHRHCTTG